MDGQNFGFQKSQKVKNSFKGPKSFLNIPEAPDKWP